MQAPLSKLLALGALFVVCATQTTARADDGVVVQDDDRARMQRLLYTSAEMAHDKRVTEAAEALAGGVTLAGFGVASWVTESEPSAREARDILGAVLVGTGGLMLIGGTYLLSTSSELEKTRDRYVAALRDHPDAGDEAVAEAERQLFARAEEAAVERTTTAIASFVFGALEIGTGIAIEATTHDPGLKWLGRGLMAGGVGAGIVGVGALAVRSEDERIADLWRSEHIARKREETHVKVVPRVGPFGVGVAGSF